MAQDPDRERLLDLVALNTRTLFFWAGCAIASQACCEVVICMAPTETEGEAIPVVYTRPGGHSISQLAPLLRYLADEMDGGRAKVQPIGPAPVPRAGEVPVCGPWGGAVCLQCGGVHGPQEPCKDADF